MGQRPVEKTQGQTLRFSTGIQLSVNYFRGLYFRYVVLFVKQPPPPLLSSSLILVPFMTPFDVTIV